jgi:hypothetical protein
VNLERILQSKTGVRFFTQEVHDANQSF